MQPMPIPQGCTLERRASREPDHQEPALLRRDEDGRVLAEVQTIDGGELGFAALAARVRQAIRAI